MAGTEDKNYGVPEMKANLDLYSLIEEMAGSPSTQDSRAKDIYSVVETIVQQEKWSHVYNEANSERRKGETVLHTAIKRLQFTSTQEKNILKILVDNFPKLLHLDRVNTEYAGQTPLHMAVTKGNIWVVNTLLTKLSTKEHRARKTGLLKRLAVGKVFTNTVMMAELPLSIAAVTCNKGMFDLLIEHGAELDATNRHGDNVCHSLIRYAFLYPEKLQDLLEMCSYISEDPAPYDSGSKAVMNRKLRKKIWLMENKDGYNPLQLAAKFGQHEIFTFIMNLDVYCRENVNDGLFDIKIYDVTEIDAISYMDTKERTGLERRPLVQTTIEDVPGLRAVSETPESCQRSTLQMLLQLEPGCAFQFLLFPPLRRIIDKKWDMYRLYFYPWFILHFIYMCILTWYGIERSRQNENVEGGFDIHRNPNYVRDMCYDGFGIALGIVDVVVGIVYLLEAVTRLMRRRMPWTLRSFTNPYGNGTFQIMFVLFGTLLITDFPLAILAPSYENYLLMVAVIIGWFLMLFFLRALRPFSFFTVMIQKVLIGDLFRFFVILSCELVGFSTAMYMAIQGASEIDSEFANFGRVVVSMFKLMVGLGEVNLIYQTRHPVLVILLFIIFIIMTTILMINSLIAMLSRTCTDLVENVGTMSARDMHWKLQKLSAVLYIESILPSCAIKCVGTKQKSLRYSSQLSRRNKVTRYMLEVRSLQNEDHNNKEDTVSASWGFRTLQLNALLHRQALRMERPLSGVRQTIANIMDRGKKHKDRGNEGQKESKNASAENRIIDKETKVTKVTRTRKGVTESNNRKIDEQLSYRPNPQGMFQTQDFYNRETDDPGITENAHKHPSHYKNSVHTMRRTASPGQPNIIPPAVENGSEVVINAGYDQTELPYVQSTENNDNQIYNRAMSLNQEQPIDVGIQETHGRAPYRRITPVHFQLHQEDFEMPNAVNDPLKMLDVQMENQVTSSSRGQSLLGREKLEIYHFNRCRHCSEDESKY